MYEVNIIKNLKNKIIIYHPVNTMHDGHILFLIRKFG